MTPMEVTEEQVEPMLTLTREDDINWMVLTSNNQQDTFMPSQTSPKETELRKPTGMFHSSYDISKKNPAFRG